MLAVPREFRASFVALLYNLNSSDTHAQSLRELCIVRPCIYRGPAPGKSKLFTPSEEDRNIPTNTVNLFEC